MPRLSHRLPVSHLHKPSGLARLRIAGKEYWLGAFGSAEAQSEYDRLIAAYLANGRKAPIAEPAQPTIALAGFAGGQATVTVLIAEFWEWAQTHYRATDGTSTREADNFRATLRRLRKRYGSLPVDGFGPARLLEFRSRLVAEGLARRTINASVRRVRQVFRWGVSRKLVKAETLVRLDTLEPLRSGRGGRETSGSRGPVDWSLVEATLPALPLMLQALVVVGYHTGARRGELARLTTGMIDRSGDVWTADPSRHKTTHRGKGRRLYFWSQSQGSSRILVDDRSAG